MHRNMENYSTRKMREMVSDALDMNKPFLSQVNWTDQNEMCENPKSRELVSVNIYF